MKIFVATTSKDEVDSHYKKDTLTIGKYLIENNIDLVFGCDYHGCMGVLYNLYKENNREIYAYNIPIYNINLDKVHNIPVKNIPERTLNMLNDSDIWLFLPGGIGTYQELLTAVDIKRTYNINKPLIIYNDNHYYDDLLNIIKKLEKSKFSSNIESIYKIANNTSEVIKYIKDVI